MKKTYRQPYIDVTVIDMELLLKSQHCIDEHLTRAILVATQPLTGMNTASEII